MLRDNCKAREQDSTGKYHYVKRADGEEEIDSQQILCEKAHENKKQIESKESSWTFKSFWSTLFPKE